MLSTTIYSITMHVAKPIQTFRKSMGKRWKWLKRLLPNAQKIHNNYCCTVRLIWTAIISNHYERRVKKHQF